jgi:hypothetical protein
MPPAGKKRIPAELAIGETPKNFNSAHTAR